MKLRFLIPAVIFLALCGVFGWMLYRTGVEGYNVSVLQSPLIGKRAPSFRVASLEDPEKFVDSSDFAGKPFVLNVWGTWCVECRYEHPVLLEIARKNLVPIVGLDHKDDRDQALRWLQTLGNPYVATAFDEDGRVGLDWGVYGAPETFLIGGDGTVLYKQVGALTMQVWEEHFVPRLQPARPVGGE